MVEILNDDFISDDIHIFLIDTEIKSPTAPLVEHFKDLRNDKASGILILYGLAN